MFYNALFEIKWNFADGTALNFEHEAQKVACRRHCPIKLHRLLSALSADPKRGQMPGNIVGIERRARECAHRVGRMDAGPISA